ncbi:Lrp/AsnC family transcriptional regulator [Spiribacter halobius]|uniref:Lrp/AsnC family transcriptional regulator n=1 Tax=Sediminicurvatus halobius TaxID=2182432 RepID=A0A2U2N719_9GAMM|nr:Lrp/AsnC family transcriptional regulator [Spiribacter halobius]PWG64878.1 Lrp/AsnC family transcriptional regulator [Spiribacter halobius]UEX78267.1 Lrp/AsnC family transcriptional regulator [Spiribacter halobius]
METVDRAILELLVEDSRLSFAEIGRRVGISRAYARERIQQLVRDGVIEKFTAVVNPVKLGRGVSAFLDVRVRPSHVEHFCEVLGTAPEVVSLYLMSDMQSLHIHTLTDTEEHLDAFVSRHFFSSDGVASVDCKLLLRRIKHRRGGPRV